MAGTFEPDWEEPPRIKSINIPGRRMGKNSAMKYKQLMDEMKKYTGSSGGGGLNNWQDEALKYADAWKNGMVNVPYNAPSYNPNYPEPPKDHRIVLFYGFNGLLAQKYSLVEGMSQQEIVARMEIAKNKVPFKIMYASEFAPIAQQFAGSPNELTEIPFDDAMNKIRIGMQREEQEFEDAEEDEFTDNCLETCKPGDHKCK